MIKSTLSKIAILAALALPACKPYTVTTLEDLPKPAAQFELTEFEKRVSLRPIERKRDLKIIDVELCKGSIDDKCLEVTEVQDGTPVYCRTTFSTLGLHEDKIKIKVGSLAVQDVVVKDYEFSVKLPLTNLSIGKNDLEVTVSNETHKLEAKSPASLNLITGDYVKIKSLELCAGGTCSTNTFRRGKTMPFSTPKGTKNIDFEVELDSLKYNAPTPSFIGAYTLTSPDGKIVREGVLDSTESHLSGEFNSKRLELGPYKLKVKIVEMDGTLTTQREYPLNITGLEVSNPIRSYAYYSNMGDLPKKYRGSFPIWDRSKLIIFFGFDVHSYTGRGKNLHLTGNFKCRNGATGNLSASEKIPSNYLEGPPIELKTNFDWNSDISYGKTCVFDFKISNGLSTKTKRTTAKIRRLGSNTPLKYDISGDD